MKIPRIDILGWLFYPFLLNPLAWALVVVVILQLIFLSWWSAKRDGTHWILTTNKPKHSYTRVVFICLVQIFTNTYWWNRKICSAQCKYLETRYFSYYPTDGSDWRYEHDWQIAYKRFQNAKIKKT